LATVGRRDSGEIGDWTVSTILMDDKSVGRSLWTLLGRGNKLMKTVYDWDAVADSTE